MNLLDMPDRHYLLATIGWLELGNSREARAEFARINPTLVDLPDVLEVQWAIHAADKDWVEALRAANRLTQVAPERASGWLHRAYATRRTPDGGLRAAWDALLPVAEKFPEESTIPYNLSCYACQMGMMEEARTWFTRAEGMDSERILQMAVSDKDLEPLWDEIRRKKT